MLVARVLAVVAVVGIVAISLTASVEPQVFSFIRHVPGGDKVGHFGLFAGVALAVTAGLHDHPRPVRNATLIVTILVLTEECYQAFVPTRTFSMLDLGASLAGVFSAAGVSWMALGRRRRIPTQSRE